MAASKIDTLHLAPRIEALITSGTNTSQTISDALKAEGHNISQPTISRYLKKVRETRTEETQKIVQDHVQKNVPADLDALESIEGQCLEWAQEDNDTFAHRLAARHIAAHMSDWVDIIRQYDGEASKDPLQAEDAARDAAKGMMALCLTWMADDISLQKKRIAAMRMASIIIDMKLRYAGLIDASKDGNVFILGKDDELDKDPETGRFVVHIGGASGKS